MNFYKLESGEGVGVEIGRSKDVISLQIKEDGGQISSIFLNKNEAEILADDLQTLIEKLK